MARPTFLSRISKLFGPEPQDNPDAGDAFTQPQPHSKAIGSSGIRIFSGYVHEDYLQNLRGYQRADIFDRMRRSDSQIKMALSAVKNQIKSAMWDIVPGDDTDEAKADADLIRHILMVDMDRPFQTFLTEALSCIDFGHSVFEITHKVVHKHPEFGSFTGIRQFGHRSPRTIYRFNVDQQTGDLLSVSQYAYGDLQRYVDIPAQYLTVFSLDQEGDNFEGISYLRAAYGPWIRKDMYQKLMAIGIEKYAVPTPVATVPEGKQNSKEYDNLVQMLQIWTSHQQNYVTKPEGWTIDFQPNPFDADKVQKAIDAEDKAIVNAFVANFLDLGMGGTHGSFALGEDKSQFFLGGLENIAKLICEVVNRGPIRQLVRMNRADRKVFPKLTCSGISDKGGLELAQSLKLLCESQVVVPDDPLEDNIRGRYALPKRSDMGQRQVNSPGSPTPEDAAAIGAAGVPGKADPAKLAESVKLAMPKIRSDIKQAKDDLKTLMQSSLGTIASDMVSQLVSKAKKAPPSKRRQVTGDVTQPGAGQYKADLVTALAKIADQALKQARKEVPKAKDAKLSEPKKSAKFKLLAEFEDLPASIQAKIKAQAALLSDTQLADLEKAVFFQFDSSIDSTDSFDVLEKDLNDSVDRYLEGISVDAGAGNAAATMVNTSRNAFFFDDEVVDEIASFTFTNPAPETPICQDLTGTTFAVDDPESDRYLPPLHHNCKSFLVPNLKGGPGEGKEIETLRPSSPSLEKYITLSDHRKSD